MLEYACKAPKGQATIHTVCTRWICAALMLHVQATRTVDPKGRQLDRLNMAIKHLTRQLSSACVQATRTVDPKGRQWNRLKTAIKQPDLVRSAQEEGETQKEFVTA